MLKNPDLNTEHDDLQIIYDSVQKEFINAKAQLYDSQLKLQKSSFLHSTPNLVEKTNLNCEGSLKLDSANDRQFSIPLPRLHVPYFDGKREEWESFRDIFQDVVHKKENIGAVQKFQYLKMFLRGEAKAALDGIQVTSANYENAWNRMLSRYNNEALLITTHLNALVSQTLIKEEDAQSLQSLLDGFNYHRESLRSLKQPVEKWDAWFVFLAERAMDQSSRRDWEKQRNSDGKTPTYDELLNFLSRRVIMLSATEACKINRQETKSRDDFRQKSRNHGSSYNTNKSRMSHTTAVNAIQGRSGCPICKNIHAITKCEKMISLNSFERRALARDRGLCFNCLGEGHECQQCPSNGVCKHCQGRHHTLLHAEKRYHSEKNSHQKNSSKRQCSEEVKSTNHS